VTLVFLGNVEAASELLIKHSVAGISAKPFILTFDRLSYWSRPKVLCLSCSQLVDEVELLVAALNGEVASCGLKTDTRPYQPHITLARHTRYLPDIKFEPIVWRAESFCLVESCSEPGGVSYKVRQQWPFIKTTV
jgi:2'-5' RNA ligase